MFNNESMLNFLLLENAPFRYFLRIYALTPFRYFIESMKNLMKNAPIPFSPCIGRSKIEVLEAILINTKRAFFGFKQLVL